MEFDEFLKMMARRKAPDEAKSLDDQMREFFKVIVFLGFLVSIKVQSSPSIC